MPTSPGSWLLLEDTPLDFRAPPPSPIATGRTSSFANESVLAEFLRHSLKVPELVLPDKIVPRQKLDETPPKIDLNSFSSLKSDVRGSESIDCACRIGCFELISHGIPYDLIMQVIDEAVGIFHLSRKDKDRMRRSTEKMYGFPERSGGEEEEREIMGEEFVWGKDEDLMSKLQGIWPEGYSNFSAKMEILSSSIDKVAAKILQFLEQQNDMAPSCRDKTEAVDFVGSVCCINKHNSMSEDMTLDEWARKLRYDAIRMLIRDSDYSHALGVHICHGCSEFRIYSKKGWASFVPQKTALVITLGDQIQTGSGGLHRHVIGKPIFNHKDNMRDHISVSFLYSPSPHPTIIKTKKQKLDDEAETITITLGQQLYIAILLTLAYQFLLFLYSMF